MASPPTSLVFKVRRYEPELISPAKPVPRELKLLSDIDDQEGLRFHIPVIQFYRYNPSMKGKDPAKIVKEALAKALVFYYPLAGRLREGPARKLMVDCNGEGILFVEGDADVSIEEFGEALHPPFPCLEELIFDVPGSSAVLNSPLILVQVTRLRCGGFILALRLNHTMADAQGLVQFMSAVGEMARGATVPSLQPVWGRHVLFARDPPHVTRTHREYDEVPDSKGTIIPLDDMAHRSFFFGSAEISAIRRFVPPHLRNCSTFEILTACLWRLRTIALRPDPEEEMRIICIINSRGKSNSFVPKGYYGNAFAFPVAVATAKELKENPLGFAVEKVREVKAGVDGEYMKSVADLMVVKGRPHFTVVRSYLVSDVTRAGFGELDIGWGMPAYGGPAKGGVGAIPGVASFYIPLKNTKGEEGILVPLCLPAPAMERFVKQLDSMLKDQNTPSSSLIISAL
ncbi:benzyl alcohol O-benzoyltransferase-like [Tripterygium wilfordii]|uniref:Benzyl alcohol O-benzoyltransferase-like n=1 Tax=Tripterygium wilfordii TaxID=458696 RepID=A0A7J7DSJ3_TRIWF|nr:benzyl alcohol O-benzoyltransferase-like [Tripterygium wilfordii]KAF5749259.1 benzyl alcohol O-benzoyltransferase-like [Tripterygium wilfordii]